jgi:hypothetical protein
MNEWVSKTKVSEKTHKKQFLRPLESKQVIERFLEYLIPPTRYSMCDSYSAVQWEVVLGAVQHPSETLALP